MFNSQDNPQCITKTGIVFVVHRLTTVLESYTQDRTTSLFENNDARPILLAQSTGNSWQQECSLSLLICLFRTRIHYWLAGFFIQQLPVNKSCCQAPSHPPPLIPRDLHLTSLCTKNNHFEPSWRGHCCISKRDFFRGNGLHFEGRFLPTARLIWD